MPFSFTSEPTLRLAMLAFAGVCVLWGVARGIGRLVMLAVSVMAGAAAGWWFFRYAPGPLISWLNGFHAEAIQWGAVASGVLAFWFSQRFLASLFSGPRMVPAGAAQRTRAGLFSLVPALLVLWGAAMAIRYSGGVARMRWVEKAAMTQRVGPPEEPPLLAQLRNGVSTGTNFNGLNAANFVSVGNWAGIGEQLGVGHSASSDELVGATVFNFGPPVCLNDKIRGADNFVSCSSNGIDCHFFRCGGVFCSCCVVVATTGSENETRSSRKSDDASCGTFHKWVLPFWSNRCTDNCHLRLGRSCL